jgi:hypothetical protein
MAQKESTPAHKMERRDKFHVGSWKASNKTHEINSISETGESIREETQESNGV